MEPGDTLRITASTFLTWKRCPDQANARLQGLFGPDTRPAFVGTLAHRIFSRHLSAGAIPSGEFVQACREEIGGSGLNNKLAGLEMKPSSLAAVIEEVRSLYDRFVRFPSEGFEGTEVTIEVDVGDDVTLQGTVDAVYREDLGGHRLVDWKTGDLGESDIQLSFYALLWALERQEVPSYVEAISVRTGEHHRAVPSSLELDRTAADVAEMVNEIRAAWSGGADLERRAGPWCRYCPILPDCPEGQAAEALLD